MPTYQFQNPDNGDIVELQFGMNDEKQFIDESGTQWKRLFTHINFPSCSKSFNEDAPMFDKNGNKLQVHKITAETAKAQGFNNVGDYIDFNNSVIDREKTPEANLQRAHDQANNKDLQQQMEHQARQNAKAADKNRAELRKAVKKSGSVSIQMENQNGMGRVKKIT